LVVDLSAGILLHPDPVMRKKKKFFFFKGIWRSSDLTDDPISSETDPSSDLSKKCPFDLFDYPTDDEYSNLERIISCQIGTLIFIKKIVDEHNHDLNIGAVAFKEERRFNNEMIEDIQFLKHHCKMGAMAQRRYLEAKYPSHFIYSEDLYAAIKIFQLTTKSLSNDAAHMSDWLDEQKKSDSR
jgi:hypothetical protein